MEMRVQSENLGRPSTLRYMSIAKSWTCLPVSHSGFFGSGWLRASQSANIGSSSGTCMVPSSGWTGAPSMRGVSAHVSTSKS